MKHQTTVRIVAASLRKNEKTYKSEARERSEPWSKPDGSVKDLGREMPERPKKNVDKKLYKNLFFIDLYI
jgi:hypothetical protein